MRKDFLVALSLANLLYMKVWSDTLYNYSNSTSSGALSLIAVVLNVLLLTLIIWCAIRFVRNFSSSAIKLAGHAGFFLLVILALNGVRASFPDFSLNRLQERFGKVSLVVAGVILGALFSYACLRARRYIISAAATILVILSPLALILSGNGVSLWHKGALATSRPLSRSLPAKEEGKPRIVWVVFDELDYRLTFAERPASLQLPEFDRLRSQSIDASRALPPADYTQESMISLTTGRLVLSWEELKLDEWLVSLAGGEKVRWSMLPNVFSLAREAGFNSGLAGWYLPYCRIIGHDLNACSSQLQQDRYGQMSLPEVMLDQAKEVPPGLIPNRLIDKSVRFVRRNKETHLFLYRTVLTNATKLAVDPNLGLVLLHYPVPHTPGIYDRHRDEFSIEPAGNYLDNLRLADRTLAELRDAMEQAGLWEKTIILVTGDHRWRPELWKKRPDFGWTPEETALAASLPTPDLRVPYLLRLPAQTQAHRYDQPFNTLVTHDLLLALLRGELASADSVVQWLDQQGSRNFTANGHGESQLFMQKDQIGVGNPAPGLEPVGLYGVWEVRVANSRKYQNPFNFTEIELHATFTAPSGKKVNFFGFYDGDGNGGQTGNVWKLRFMPDELGTWNYSYMWTDKTPGGSGTFIVVDTGLPGPLKIATDNPWYFMTAKGKPFHARPYGMQDYGPRIGSSSGWEKNSQEYIDTLKTKAVARRYNMVMASGPNRFKEGRSYWWQHQRDIFDVAVWGEYEKVLRFALDNHLYFFPFDGMAEQSAFGMPVGRVTKYIGRLIPLFDRPVGRVTPVFKRYMVARYGAFASFMGYSPTWEWPEFWSESAGNEFMSEIRRWNPFPTFLTAHDSSRASFAGWMGFSMRQANWVANDIFGGNCRACGHHGGVQAPFDNLPIMGSEEVWEAPVNDDGYPHDAAEVRRTAWGDMMVGVMPVYSEWYWNFLMGNGKGEAEVRRMFDFFYTKTRYRQHQQLNQLVSKPARQIASGTPGQEYLIYDEDGGSITINLSGVPSATIFSVLWFDPKTGVEQSGGSITGGASKTSTAPFSGDTVLLLRRVSADPPLGPGAAAR